MPFLLPSSASVKVSDLPRAWQDLKSRRQWAYAILFSDGNALAARRQCASNLSKVERTPWHNLELPFENDPDVVPTSLRETLKAHRQSNRTSLIHKITETGERHPLDLKPRLKKGSKQQTKTTGRDLVLHLQLFKSAEMPSRARRRKSLDYSGENRMLKTQWLARASMPFLSRHPWWTKMPATNKSVAQPPPPSSDRLTSEILAFEAFMSPAPDELAAADLALNDLRVCISSIMPSLKIDLVGSRSTGLASPLSDIDLNVTHPKSGTVQSLGEERRQACELLKEIWESLRKRRDFDHGQRSFRVQPSVFIEKARVPIITGFHVPTNLKFQIQCTTDAFSSMEYSKVYVAEYPTLRPLYMVLKHMLDIRGLAGGATGGLGSYPLLIMIVAALRFSEGKIRRKTAGKQLFSFLNMYSNIDFYTNGISLSPLELTLKRLGRHRSASKRAIASSASNHVPSMPATAELEEKPIDGGNSFSVLHPGEPFLMCLQDPSNPTHDLGKQVKMIKHIQAVFIQALRELQNAMNVWETGDLSKSPRDGAKFSMLEWCLSADYSILKVDRDQLKEAVRQNSEKESNDV